MRTHVGQERERANTRRERGELGGGGGGGGGTNQFAQELTCGGGQKHTLSLCPARGLNPGCSGLNSDSLTTESRPPLADRQTTNDSQTEIKG